MESDGLSQREEPLECKVCGPSEVECGTGEGAEIKTCPVWANAGCFSSEKIILANRRYSGTYNRGCSAIPTERSCQTVTVEKAGSIEVDRVSYKISLLSEISYLLRNMIIQPSSGPWYSKTMSYGPYHMNTL